MGAIQTWTVKLAPLFVTDAVECDCDVGHWDRLKCTLTATREQLAELHSRARHYAEDGCDADHHLVASAKAVLRKLEERCDQCGGSGLASDSGQLGMSSDPEGCWWCQRSGAKLPTGDVA